MVTTEFRNVFARAIVYSLTSFMLSQVCHGHPQCLDSRPPFKPTSNLTFCDQYSTFGCCSSAEDIRLRSEFDAIRSLVQHETWIRCHSYVREVLCQQCSPYSAHIFDAEGKSEARTFPGLCRIYSDQFYQTCKDVVQFLNHQLSVQSAFQTKHGFYSLVSIPDTDYCYPGLLSNPLFNNKISNVQITRKGCLCLEEFATGYGVPVFARHSGDGTNRLFIADQVGIIDVYFVENKTKMNEPFLDITDSVMLSSYIGDERGLLGIAFHPNFKENKKFYIYYSTFLTHSDYELPLYAPSMLLNHKIRISEMMVEAHNPNKANRSSERVLIEVLEPFANHNGGEIFFGDDNLLYIFIGDGGSGGDPYNFSQNKSVLLGKVLRIDVDHGQPYAIPPDNPFVNDPDALNEIFAYGVRNIWRCGKDRGDAHTGEGRGRVLCGDVGQNAFEEIDLLVKGANYGWNSREGFNCYDETTCGQIGPEELPVFAYPHRVGKSVTGGSFYRGCESPNLNGLYIWGDYMSGRLFSLSEDAAGQWDAEELFMCGSDVCLDGLVGDYGSWITSFGEDEHGEVYMLSVRGSDEIGSVYKIVDPARRGSPEDCPWAHKLDKIKALNVNVPPTSADANIAATSDAPLTLSVNVRTCSMAASTLLCTLMHTRG